MKFFRLNALVSHGQPLHQILELWWLQYDSLGRMRHITWLGRIPTLIFLINIRLSWAPIMIKSRLQDKITLLKLCQPFNNTARWSTRSRSQHNNIRTIDEDTFSLLISTFSALGVFHVMRYINVRYLLTYLLGEKSMFTSRSPQNLIQCGISHNAYTTSVCLHIL